MSDIILSQNPTTTKLEAAYKWLKLGASLLPHQANSKFLIAGFGPRRQSIHKPQEAEYWFKNTDYNLGVLLPKNLWCLDFDDDALFTRWSDETPVTVQQTYTEITPNGWHLIYRGELPPGLRLIAGVEIKRAILVAPSVVKGFVYKAVFSDDEIRGVGDPRSFLSLLLSGTTPSQTETKPARVETVRVPPTGNDLISRIKARWPVRWLASSLTELKPSPPGQERWFIGRCPLHDDEHPSLWVDDENNTWGCFLPGCPGHQGGDLINLYSLANKIDNQEAIKRLAWGLKP